MTASSTKASSNGSSRRYTGVRKRAWGRWVSEIRLPNSRERVWLGSYETAEEAACAFDAATIHMNSKTMMMRRSSSHGGVGGNSNRRRRGRKRKGRANLPEFQVELNEAVLQLQRRLLMMKNNNSAEKMIHNIDKDEIRYVASMAAKLFLRIPPPRSPPAAAAATAAIATSPPPNSFSSNLPTFLPPPHLPLLSDDDLATLRQLESDLSTFFDL